jgi:hypothetical protein
MSSSGDGSVAASRQAAAAASVSCSSSGMSCRFKTEQKLAKISSTDILWIGWGGGGGGCTGNQSSWIMSSSSGRSSWSSYLWSESMPGPAGDLWRKLHSTTAVVRHTLMSNRFTGIG